MNPHACRELAKAYCALDNPVQSAENILRIAEFGSRTLQPIRETGQAPEGFLRQ